MLSHALIIGNFPSRSSIFPQSNIENCLQTFYGSLCYFESQIADEPTSNLKSIFDPYSFKTVTKNVF